MTENYRCPNCGATNTRFRATMGSHICQRCGHTWAPITVGKRKSWLTRIATWIALIITAITILDYIFGHGSIAMIITSVIAWLAVFGIAYWREDRLQGGQSKTTGNEPYRCQKPDCGNVFSGDEGFCTVCGTPKARPLTVSEHLQCGSCGRAFDRNVQFCPGCGTQAY